MPCLFCEKGLLCKRNIEYDTVSEEKESMCANTDSDRNIGHSLF